MRVLHGTYEIAGQGMVLAEGLRRIGVDAKSFAYRVDWDGRVPDEVVDLDALAFGARQAAKREAFARLAPAFDVFHFHFGTSFEWTPLPFDLPFLRQLDVPRLKRMGKHVVMHFHGCEVRNKRSCAPATRARPRARSAIRSASRSSSASFSTRARKYADRVFYSTLDLAESVPFGVQLPLAIDAAHWEAAGDAADASLSAAAGGGAPPRDGVRGPVVIAHAPTQRLIKGTRYVEAAVEELRATFPRLELRMFERLPWADMPQALAQCDLLVDQLFMGWYGLLAIEGMSVGRPVVCAMRPDFARTVPDCPVIDASPTTLAAVLAPLVANPSLRADLGRRGRAYARAQHDLDVVARHAAHALRRDPRTVIARLAVADGLDGAAHARWTAATLLDTTALAWRADDVPGGEPGPLVFVGPPERAPAGAAVVLPWAGLAPWAPDSLALTTLDGVTLPVPSGRADAGADARTLPAPFLRAAYALLAARGRAPGHGARPVELLPGDGVAARCARRARPPARQRARGRARAPARRLGRGAWRPPRFAVALARGRALRGRAHARRGRGAARLRARCAPARLQDPRPARLRVARRAHPRGARARRAARADDPYWQFDRWVEAEEARGFRSSFYFCAPQPGHAHAYDATLSARRPCPLRGPSRARARPHGAARRRADSRSGSMAATTATPMRIFSRASVRPSPPRAGRL